MTAVVVAYVGVIGFIGMIIPQLIRKFYWRYQIGLQMLWNIIIGAVVMIIADFYRKYNDTTYTNSCRHRDGIARCTSPILYFN